MPERPYVFQQALRDDMSVLQHRDSDKGEEGHGTDRDGSGGIPFHERRKSCVRLGSLCSRTAQGEGLSGDGRQEFRGQGG